MSAQDHPTVGDSLAALLLNMNLNQPAQASGLTDNNNTIPEQNVENATTSANKAIKRKQKKWKRQITKRGAKSKKNAIAQMKAKT